MGSKLVLDPGLANTGAVFWDGQKIVRVETWKTDSGGVYKVEFLPAYARVHDQCRKLIAALDEFAPEEVVMETYGDFGGQVKRGVANRWTTPLLIGFMACVVETKTGVEPIWQDPTAILSPTKGIREHWKAHGTGFLPGDEKLTNDHLRSAGAHLLVRLSNERMS